MKKHTNNNSTTQNTFTSPTKQLTVTLFGVLTFMAISLTTFLATLAQIDPGTEQKNEPAEIKSAEPSTPTPTLDSAPAPAPNVTESTPTPAAEKTEKATTPKQITSKQEAAQLGEKNREFMNEYEKYATIIKQLKNLKVEYQVAKPERAIEIDKKYRQLLIDGEKIAKSMIDAGIAAYNETPNRNLFASNYIFTMISWEFHRDNYEAAVRIFKAISNKEVPIEANILYVYAGLSAVITCDFDEADAWLKKSQENGAFDNYIKSLMAVQPQKRGMPSQEQIQAQKYLGWIKDLSEIKADWTKEQAIRKAEEEANKDAAKKLPRVELNTSKGKIVLELFENEAPNTVANFISLVEKKFYSRSKFHRVLPGFMAQGGDNGRGGPGYQIDDECRKPDTRKHFRGSISMANRGPNTNGSQFFLTFVKTEHLDGRHTVFGRIVEGIEVLADIQRVDPDDTETPIGDIDEIIDAKVLNKRDHEYQPIKSK